ncbi:hypothetical protein ACWD33_01640 [Streptomyces xiamenensis]|uniref:Secreted protein n=1 Tax=Streptomyces xiamenensis TaxID=408015 RepID=A0A0F7FX45_9ACTN|nr:hypothetical protein [Streptomyces xiamenensis]AKG45017.1 secreted protein [Streptomyces xiamenensis]
MAAFTLFVFAQAAVTRSGGQSAADAAALAAARESRDHLYELFRDAILEDEDLGDVLAGVDFRTGAACTEAAPRLAARNNAVVTACEPDVSRFGYTVEVETLDTVGDSFIPGTENQTARATATAVVAARCEPTSQEEEEIGLSCDERDWSFDPRDDGEVPEARDLFQVYLDD